MTWRGDQRGAAGSALVAGVCLVLVSVFMAGAVLIQWFYLARRAEHTAELAALAAVSATVEGSSACGAAGEAARRNHGTVTGCEVAVSGRAVVVQVTVGVPLEPRVPWGPSRLTRSATAGT
ncbi:Rv3654c family TadE-like protein [Tessaracoccus sp. Z1128]